jgi:hypothetical protein
VCGDEPGRGVYLDGQKDADKEGQTDLMISWGSWDQGLMPEEDLPFVEGSCDFVELSILIDCALSRKSAALVTTSVNP